MRIAIAVAALLVAEIAAAQQTYVRPYIRQDGTIVQPHFRTPSNSQRWDNWSSENNQNPWTGKRGTEPNEFSNPPVYNQGRRPRVDPYYNTMPADPYYPSPRQSRRRW